MRLRRIASLLLSYAAVARGAPLAPPVVVNVDAGAEVIVFLPGFDVTGRPLQASVVSLPSVGAVFQITNSQPLGRGLPILSSNGIPVRVSGSRSRIVYVAPGGPTPPGAWASFQYTVSDGVTVSSQGTVWVIPPHRRLVWSDFSDGTDGWTIVDNGRKEAAKPAGGAAFEPLSRGPLLNHYLQGHDAEIATVTTARPALAGHRMADIARWRFVAPAVAGGYSGPLTASYGGALRLDMGCFAGDFAPRAQTTDLPLLTLECSTCAGGAGVRLGVFSGMVPGVALEARTRALVVPMVPASWRKDPKNSLQPWGNITECELTSVLSAVSALTVLGDQTAGYETVAIDNVGLVHAVPFLFPRQCVQ